jgi:hypothetical protein
MVSQIAYDRLDRRVLIMVNQHEYGFRFFRFV